MKTIRIVNIILLGIVIILIILKLSPQISAITGNVVYSLDTSQPECQFYNLGELNKIQTDTCCHEIQEQLACKPAAGNESSLKCYTSEKSERYYIINHKTFSYCKKEGYNVKTE